VFLRIPGRAAPRALRARNYFDRFRALWWKIERKNSFAKVFFLYAALHIAMTKAQRADRDKPALIVFDPRLFLNNRVLWLLVQLLDLELGDPVGRVDAGGAAQADVSGGGFCPIKGSAIAQEVAGVNRNIDLAVPHVDLDARLSLAGDRAGPGLRRAFDPDQFFG
jgi:hypothetical protein